MLGPTQFALHELGVVVGSVREEVDDVLGRHVRLLIPIALGETPLQRVADPFESLLRDLIAHSAERGNRDHLKVQLGPELVGEQAAITGQFSDRAEKRDQFGRLYGLVDVLLTCSDGRSPNL